MKLLRHNQFHKHRGGRTISLFKSNQQRTYIFESTTVRTKHIAQTIQVDPVQNLKEFKLFYQAPFLIYRDDAFWVAPFWSEVNDFFKTKNPFWSHAECALFLVRKNNVVVGRIAAIIDDKFCETVGEKIGFFGFFECVNDDVAAHALLQAAQEWLIEKKMNVMRGPIDGRVDVGCGFVLSGFDSRPSILSSYTPEYYLTFAEEFGLQKIRDLFLYSIDLTKPIPPRLEEKAQHCAAFGVKLRAFHRLRTGRELKWWIYLFLETFADHWGYVPVSPEEVRTRFGVKQLRWIVDPRLFLIAEYKGSPVAYLWATPEYNQIFQRMKGRLGLKQLIQFLLLKGHIRTGKLHFVGIKKEFRDKNIGSYLNYSILVEMKNRGYTSAEVGWIDEENTAAHTTIAITGATVYKKHRVFQKSLQSI